MTHKRPALIALAAALLFSAAATTLQAQQAPPAAGDEAQLIAVLQQADAPLFDKAKACQALAVVGGQKCVPVLAGLLGDEDLSHYARFGLEPIPDPSVDKAFRAALGKLEGMLLVGVIDSVGLRRDAKAAGALKKLLGSSDRQVAAAAAAALGRIATDECVAALKQALTGAESLRPAVGDACLSACDMLLAAGKGDAAVGLYDAVREADVPKHIQVAAAHGAIRARGAEGLPLLAEMLGSDDKSLFAVALRVAHEMPAERITPVLVAEIAKWEPAPKVPAKLLVIKKARYGADTRWVDVADRLSAAIKNNCLSIEAGNTIAGDPAPKTVKTLQVTYVLGDEEKSVELAEKETLEIKGDPVAEHPREVQIVSVLGDVGDASAVPALLEIAEGGLWDVRPAALAGLARLGDARAVPVLLEAARQPGAVGVAARAGLAKIEADGADAAILEAFQKSEGTQRATLIDLVGQRGIAAAVPTLFEASHDEDAAVRRAAIGALGVTVSLDQLDAFLGQLMKPEDPEDVAVLRQALGRAGLRMPDRDATAATFLSRIAGADPEAQAALLELAGTVGGAKALAGVAAAARSEDEALQDAATRVLGEWSSPDAAPVLLELAGTPGKFQIRALRGYIRIPRQLGVSDAEKVAMCRKAMAVATRKDEKRLVLDVLPRVRTTASLAFAVEQLEDRALKQKAGAVAVALSERLVDHAPAQVAEAMDRVIAASLNEKVTARAKALSRQAKNLLPK